MDSGDDDTRAAGRGSSPGTRLGTQPGTEPGILHRGHLFHLTGRPRLEEAAAALVEVRDGGLWVDADGRIAWSGAWSERPPEAAEAEVVDHGDAFLLPGFVDTHLHFPQVYSIAAHGGGSLLEWLDRHIFPAEARLADAAFAARAAEELCRRLAAAGTTTAMVFGSAFPVAQEALFRALAASGLRAVVGRGIQTVGPPAARPLLTGEDEAVRLTEAEIERWHGAADGRLAVAVVPRFALSVTRRTLAALGELYDHHRGSGVYFTTHLSEDARPGDGEVAATLRGYGVERYLDAYDGRFLAGSRRGGASLLGRRSVMAHCVHCGDDELARLAETGTSVAHCPTSQLFLGSGTMPWRRTVAAGVNVAVGTDVAAGDTWFVPQVLNAAFKVHLSEPGTARAALHPAQLLHLATVAGARALDLEDTIGNLDPGRDADFVVLDPGRWEPLASLLEHGGRDAEGPQGSAERLFTLLMAANQTAVAGLWVRGRQVSGRPVLEEESHTRPRLER